MQAQLDNLQTLLDVPFVRRTRRNHGLEHATIHMLSRRVPNLRMAGRSDDKGFWLLGEAETPQVEQAVDEALRRMRGGEHQLAIHPNCGTNLVTTAFLGGGVTLLALAGSENEQHGKFNRFPLVVVGLMFAALAGPVLGTRLQEHVTTLGDPGDLEVVSVTRHERMNVVSHRVVTRST